jgi:hypothetical protein
VSVKVLRSSIRSGRLPRVVYRNNKGIESGLIHSFAAKAARPLDIPSRHPLMLSHRADVNNLRLATPSVECGT